MRIIPLFALAALACFSAASALAAAPKNHQFDGTYHLLAPAFKAALHYDCPAQGSSAAIHMSFPLPVKAENVHVLDGVYDGRTIQGTGSIGRISYQLTVPFGPGKATFATSITFNSTFHSMTVAMHALGKGPLGCAFSGGYIQKGRRIGA
jgi:hypothetical protein